MLAFNICCIHRTTAFICFFSKKTLACHLWLRRALACHLWLWRALACHLWLWRALVSAHRCLWRALVMLRYVCTVHSCNVAMLCVVYAVWVAVCLTCFARAGGQTARKRLVTASRDQGYVPTIFLHALCFLPRFVCVHHMLRSPFRKTWFWWCLCSTNHSYVIMFTIVIRLHTVKVLKMCFRGKCWFCRSSVLTNAPNNIIHYVSNRVLLPVFLTLN